MLVPMERATVMAMRGKMSNAFIAVLQCIVSIALGGAFDTLSDIWDEDDQDENDAGR